MREVSLPQNDDGVEDIPIQEVHPHCRPHRHSARASLHRVALWASLRREIHSESTWPYTRSQGARGAERKRRQLAEAKTRESSKRDFEAYGEQIQNFSIFRYLRRVLTAVDDDWLALVGNFGKAQKSWGRVSRILSWEGADLKVSRILQGGGPGGVSVRGGDMGPHPEDVAGHGQFSTQVREEDHWEESAAT